MRYNKIQVALYRLVDGFLRHVEGEKHTRTIQCNVACLQSGVVITLLQGSMRKGFYSV